MDSKPLVSTIIIFLNAERFIQEAIESIFAQTYEHWEILLVDDGSTDTSTEIAQRYAVQVPEKVRYLEHRNHQNRGMSASRNLGIRHAKGEFIAFLDADDLWLPHKLEQQVAIMSSHPEAALVYGLDQYWFSWTGKPEDSKPDFIPRLGVQPNQLVKPPRLLSLFLLGKAAIPCPTNILVRRTVFEDVGEFEETFRGMYAVYEDQAFYAKVCLKKVFFVSDTCWDRYRQHPDASCAVAQRTGQEYIARQFFLNWLENYLSQQGITDTEIWRALRRAQWQNRHPALARLLRGTQRLARLFNDRVKKL
jgi:glycosyltransferase involved in cell wall biosynthesis